MLIPLVLAGLAIGAIVMAANKGAKGSMWNIAIQSPAPIASSAAMIAMVMGFDPNHTQLSMNQDTPGMTILTIMFDDSYKAPIPTVGQTFNFNGVPGTIRAVNKAPTGTGL